MSLKKIKKLNSITDTLNSQTGNDLIDQVSKFEEKDKKDNVSKVQANQKDSKSKEDETERMTASYFIKKSNYKSLKQLAIKKSFETGELIGTSAILDQILDKELSKLEKR